MNVPLYINSFRDWWYELKIWFVCLVKILSCRVILRVVLSSLWSHSFASQAFSCNTRNNFIVIGHLWSFSFALKFLFLSFFSFFSTLLLFFLLIQFLCLKVCVELFKLLLKSKVWKYHKSLALYKVKSLKMIKPLFSHKISNNNSSRSRHPSITMHKHASSWVSSHSYKVNTRRHESNDVLLWHIK